MLHASACGLQDSPVPTGLPARADNGARATT